MPKYKQDRDGLFKRKGSPYYWASYVDASGRRVRRSTGIRFSKEGRKEAVALLAKWKLEAHKEKYWDEKPSPTFDELMVLYLKSRTPHKRDPARDRYSAKQLYPFFSGLELRDITGPMVSEYVAKRRETVSESTVNREVGLLSNAINWARKDLGWDVENPALGRRLREPAGRLRWLSQDEAERLLAAAYEQKKYRYIADFIRLGLHTGMRKGEMLGLEWSRVDLNRGLIYLHAEHQKSGKVGSVPINQEARRALVNRARFRAKHCPNAKWVFCRRNGTRIQNIPRSFQRACTDAKITDFRPHDLRHTCAAWLVQAGVSIREVAELLRHADIRVTMRYAHLSPDNVKAAVSRLDALTSQSGHTDRVEGQGKGT